MASFADAVNALVAERDRQFVARIAADYNLDLAELMKKYTETVVKAPRKYKKRDPTTVTVVSEKTKAEKPKCTACTAKKEPCKFSALKGSAFCKRHMEQPQTEAVPKEPKAPKAPKAVKPPQPTHSHDLSDGNVAECDLCQSHGNPLVETAHFEVVRALIEGAGADEEEYEDEDF